MQREGDFLLIRLGRPPYPNRHAGTMANEQTYIMIKPDGVQRGLVAEVIKRFEQRGYTLKALKMQITEKAHVSGVPAFCQQHCRRGDWAMRQWTCWHAMGVPIVTKQQHNKAFAAVLKTA